MIWYKEIKPLYYNYFLIFSGWVVNHHLTSYRRFYLEKKFTFSYNWLNTNIFKKYKLYYVSQYKNPYWKGFNKKRSISNLLYKILCVSTNLIILVDIPLIYTSIKRLNINLFDFVFIGIVNFILLLWNIEYPYFFIFFSN